MFRVLASDGDSGAPRKLELSLVGDEQGFFVIDTAEGHDENGVARATIVTAPESNIDREAEVRRDYLV